MEVMMGMRPEVEVGMEYVLGIGIGMEVVVIWG